MQRAASQPLLQRSGPSFTSSPLCQAIESELHLMATEATKIAAKASALAAARQQVSGVQELWIGACNNLKDLHAALSSANQQVLDLRAQLDYAEAQNSGLQGVFDAANAHIANLLRQERNLIESLQASRHRKLQLVEQAHKQSKQQLHQAQEQLSHAEAAAEAAKQEASDLAVQLAGAAGQLAQAKETALAAQLQTETARQEVASLKAKLAAVADASKRCARTNRLLSERMSGLEAELASVTGAAQHSAAQAAAAVQAQAELAQRLDAALQQVEALKSETLQCMQAAQLATLQDKHRLSAQLESLQAAHAEQAAALRVCRAQAAEAWRALEEDERRLSEAQAQLEAALLEVERVSSLLEAAHHVTVQQPKNPRVLVTDLSTACTQSAAPLTAASNKSAPADVIKHSSTPMLASKAAPVVLAVAQPASTPIKHEQELQAPTTPAAGQGRSYSAAAGHSSALQRMRKTSSMLRAAAASTPATDLPTTLRSLHSEDALLQAQAVMHLKSMVTSNSSSSSPAAGCDAPAVQAAVLGSLDRLVELMECSSVNRDIACIFTYLADRPQEPSAPASNAALIARAPNYLKRLAGLLNCVYDDAQEAAARVIAALARNDAATKAALGKLPGCIPRLVTLLQGSRNDGVLEAVAAALGHLAHCCPANQLAIASIPGCLTRLRALAAGTHGYCVRGRALRVQESVGRSKSAGGAAAAMQA